ncbi:MAG: response regulator transcription factor [Bryobacterales bacterium]|nr:response regulator transcription factor [Bryobacterales bacterium]
MGTVLNPICVLIAGRQGCHALQRLIESNHGFRITGRAVDGSTAVAMTRRLRPRVLLLDITLPKWDELTSIRQMESPPGVVAMVDSLERKQIVEALRLGAIGIVSKRAAPRVLRNSIRMASEGRYWMEAETLGILVETFREFLPHSNGNVKPPAACDLTARELEIVARVAAGLSNREVSEEFSISERTVKHHLTNIFSKVGVSNRVSLALFATNHHLTNGYGCPPDLRRQARRADVSL